MSDIGGLVAVALAIFVAGHVLSSSIKSAKDVKWEYCRMHGSEIFYYGVEGARTEKVPGDGSIDADMQAIARLGLEGWELASLTEGTGWYLKRRIRSSD